MKSMDATALNSKVDHQFLRHPRDIFHAALCISASAFVSITLIVWTLK